MKRVSANIGLAAPRISNSWMLTDAQGRRFVIDTGHVVERGLLRRSLWRAGVRSQGDLTAVLLTHRHSDHAGNAAWLRKKFDCPIICHQDDAAILSGTTPPERLRGRPTHPSSRTPRALAAAQELLCHFEDRFRARSPVDDTFDDGAWRWGFHVIPVPGHTEGSVLLWHEPTCALFSGDAILAGPPVQRTRVRLQLAVPKFSVDVALCRRHVRHYLESAPRVATLCAGHGPPMHPESLDLRDHF